MAHGLFAARWRSGVFFYVLRYYIMTELFAAYLFVAGNLALFAACQWVWDRYIF